MRTAVEDPRGRANTPGCIIGLTRRVGEMFSAARARQRCAAICLPAAMASILLGIAPGPSAAARAPDLHTQIEHASHNSFITLKMSDGISVAGVFNGFIGDWRDSVAYAARYEQWRTARGAEVPRLDESVSIIVVAGDTLRGSFRGAGPAFLALKTNDSRLLTPVNYDIIASMSREGGPRVASGSELHGALLEAPHLAGVSLRQGASTVVVPRELIRGVEGSSGQGGSSTGTAIVLIALGAAVVGVLICASAANSASNDIGSSCSKTGSNSSASIDGLFASGDLTHGPGLWPRGEIRRP